MTRFWYLFAYDIVEYPVRREVWQTLADRGAVRVQRSVGWLSLTAAERRSLVAVLSGLLGPQDRVHWWRTCGLCPPPLGSRGRGQLAPSSPPGEAPWIV